VLKDGTQEDHRQMTNVVKFLMCHMVSSMPFNDLDIHHVCLGTLFHKIS